MSRAKRTQQFRNRVEYEWVKKYWSFIQENVDWDAKSLWWIFKNPNIQIAINEKV